MHAFNSVDLNSRYVQQLAVKCSNMWYIIFISISKSLYWTVKSSNWNAFKLCSVTITITHTRRSAVLNGSLWWRFHRNKYNDSYRSDAFLLQKKYFFVHFLINVLSVCLMVNASNKKMKENDLWPFVVWKCSDRLTRVVRLHRISSIDDFIPAMCSVSF